MKNLFTGSHQKLRVEDTVVSEITNKLYGYSNREPEIQALMESISEIGLQQPISVVKFRSQHVIADGVLRQMACIRLNLNEIDCIVSGIEVEDELSLTDIIIQNQLHKIKTDPEILNEVKSLLRIDSDDTNPLRDKDKRVSLVSSLLGGKGWGRNNVFSFEKILRWEKNTNSEQRLAERVISNEINISKALETISLIENPLFDKGKEDESCIVDGFINGKYTAEKAEKLMGSYDRKKAEEPTQIDLYPIDERKYTILQGNIEEIELPNDLEIDTIFTSPPYFQLVRYGTDPNELGWEKTPDLYVKRLAGILMKCFARLKNTGSMFINIGETHKDFQCLGIIDRLTCELMNQGVRLVDKIIWEKPVAKPLNNNVRRLNPAYEVILHFSKTKDYYFDPIRTTNEKRLKVSKGCKEHGVKTTSYHIPNRFGALRNFLNREDLKNIIKLRIHQNRTKHVEGEEEHPATFSMDLPLIPLALTCPKSENTVVFDPFMGSGSCGVTAIKMGFKFVGVELYEKNIVTAQRILNESQQDFDQSELDSLLEKYIPYEKTDLKDVA